MLKPGVNGAFAALDLPRIRHNRNRQASRKFQHRLPTD
jgi:hypothetical protein